MVNSTSQPPPLLRVADRQIGDLSDDPRGASIGGGVTPFRQVPRTPGRRDPSLSFGGNSHAGSLQVSEIARDGIGYRRDPSGSNEGRDSEQFRTDSEGSHLAGNGEHRASTPAREGVIGEDHRRTSEEVDDDDLPSLVPDAGHPALEGDEGVDTTPNGGTVSRANSTLADHRQGHGDRRVSPRRLAAGAAASNSRDLSNPLDAPMGIESALSPSVVGGASDLLRRLLDQLARLRQGQGFQGIKELPLKGKLGEPALKATIQVWRDSASIDPIDSLRELVDRFQSIKEVERLVGMPKDDRSRYCTGYAKGYRALFFQSLLYIRRDLQEARSRRHDKLSSGARTRIDHRVPAQSKVLQWYFHGAGPESLKDQGFLYDHLPALIFSTATWKEMEVLVRLMKERGKAGLDVLPDVLLNSLRLDHQKMGLEDFVVEEGHKKDWRLPVCLYPESFEDYQAALVDLEPKGYVMPTTAQLTAARQWIASRPVRG